MIMNMLLIHYVLIMRVLLYLTLLLFFNERLTHKIKTQILKIEIKVISILRRNLRLRIWKDRIKIYWMIFFFLKSISSFSSNLCISIFRWKLNIKFVMFFNIKWISCLLWLKGILLLRYWINILDLLLIRIIFILVWRIVLRRIFLFQLIKHWMLFHRNLIHLLFLFFTWRVEKLVLKPLKIEIKVWTWLV